MHNDLQYLQLSIITYHYKTGQLLTIPRVIHYYTESSYVNVKPVWDASALVCTHRLTDSNMGVTAEKMPRVFTVTPPQ